MRPRILQVLFGAFVCLASSSQVVGRQILTFAADGKVSLTAPRPRLGAVLDEIGTHAKFPIIVAEELADEPVVPIRGLPLDEALKRLLAGYDAFYLFSASDGSPASIKGIWVFPRGEGRELAPVPPTLWASTKEVEARLDDLDPGVRMEAFETLIERQGDRGLQTLTKAFGDPDDSVRLAALQAGIEAGIEIPTSQLFGLVLGDRSRHVRLLALQAAETSPEVDAIAGSVKDDPDEEVRNLARLLLRHLEPPADPGSPQSP